MRPIGAALSMLTMVSLLTVLSVPTVFSMLTMLSMLTVLSMLTMVSMPSFRNYYYAARPMMHLGSTWASCRCLYGAKPMVR